MDGYELLVSAAERSEPREAVLMLAEAADACFYSGAADRMLAAAERAHRLADNDPVAQYYASSARGSPAATAHPISAAHWSSTVADRSTTTRSHSPGRRSDRSSCA